MMDVHTATELAHKNGYAKGFLEGRQDMINLTKSQCENLADFIKDNILQAIRDDVEIDNMDWLVNMVDAYKKLREGEKT